MFKGPTIIKGDGSLGARADDQGNIGGMVFGGVLPTGTYTTLGSSVRLIQASDADAMGFTAAYDATNRVLIRYHINEFFRINPNGTLWIMVVAQTTTMTQMVNVTLNFANKLIIDSGKKIKFLGVIRNPASGYTPTLTGGLDGDVLTAVPMAQALADAWAAQNIYIDSIVIEGRELNGTLASTNLRTLASPNVNVVVAQDKDVANRDALYAKTAAVGTLLGSIGVREVQEDYGSINAANNPIPGNATMPISSAAFALFINPALSNGNLVNTLTAAEVALLRTNAYIFADSYPDETDVYWSGSHACTTLSSDFAYSVNTRVWNRGARLVTKKIVKKFNSTVATNDAGQIESITASEWEEQINNSNDGLGLLKAEGAATKTAVYINPAQEIFASSTLAVQMTIRPFGYARTITGTLSFTK